MAQQGMWSEVKCWPSATTMNGDARQVTAYTPCSTSSITTPGTQYHIPVLALPHQPNSLSSFTTSSLLDQRDTQLIHGLGLHAVGPVSISNVSPSGLNTYRALGVKPMRITRRCNLLHGYGFYAE